MSIQFDATTRNAMADAIETSIGTGPTLEIRSGAKPANCAAADSGTLLASMALPSDWLANAASGAKTLLGTWQDPAGNNAGTAAHFRIKDSGTACRMQGDVTATGGGGDLTLDNTSIAVGQQVNIASFTLTIGNA
jgi:hypothetical protein